MQIKVQVIVFHCCYYNNDFLSLLKISPLTLQNYSYTSYYWSFQKEKKTIVSIRFLYFVPRYFTERYMQHRVWAGGKTDRPMGGRRAQKPGQTLSKVLWRGGSLATVKRQRWEDGILYTKKKKQEWRGKHRREIERKRVRVSQNEKGSVDRFSVRERESERVNDCEEGDGKETERESE